MQQLPFLNMGVDNFFLDLVFADNSNIFQWVVIILTFIIGFLEIVKQLHRFKY
jgi:hypothetical protein